MFDFLSLDVVRVVDSRRQFQSTADLLEHLICQIELIWLYSLTVLSILNVCSVRHCSMYSSPVSGIFAHTQVTDMCDYLIIIHVPAPPAVLPVFSCLLTTSATNELAVWWNHCFCTN